MVVEVSSLANANIICDLLHCTPETNIILCATAVVNVYFYRPNIMLISAWDDEMPIFAKVEQMICIISKLHLIIQPWETVYHEDHYGAYVVKENVTQPLQMREPDNIFDHRPVHACQNYINTDNQ